MAVVISVIAGRYSAAYTPVGGSSLDLGILDDPGWRLSFVPELEKVNNSDAYGAAVIEGIWLGFSFVGLDAMSKEWKTGPLRASNPGTAYAASGSTTFRPGVVGRRVSDAVGGSLIMTSTATTPAASSPATLTNTHCVARSGSTTEWIFGPRHRKAPLSFEFLAYDGGSGVPEYFACT